MANRYSEAAIAGIIIKVGNMRKNIPVFVVFAAALLFSIVREWNAPVACIRQVMASERVQKSR